MTSQPLRKLARVSAIAVFCAWSLAAAGLELENHPALHELIDELVSEHEFERAELERLFRHVALRQEVLRAIQRPAERLPWYKYQALFISDRVIHDGTVFWERHAAALDRAAAQYGVPPAVIVAIIGVETRYGKVLGKHRVVDSLTTLALGYPRRRAFFRRELIEFLLLAREEGLDPLALNGSYAGAMGVPQFMPSSYRQYAVDFSGDDRRDLIFEPVDAIGSVAHYLYRHRWRRDQPIVGSVSISAGVDVDGLLNKKLKPNSTVAQLAAAGVIVNNAPDDAMAAGLLRLERSDGIEYRVGYDNFFVVTRYNSSILYAMAVFELSQAISQHRARI